MNPNINDYSSFLPAIDIENGLKRTRGDKKLFFSLLGRFKVEDLTTALIEAIRTSDFQSADEHAHALKGTAANLGLLQLQEAAAEVELHVRNKTECLHLIDKITDAAEMYKKCMEALTA